MSLARASYAVAVFRSEKRPMGTADQPFARTIQKAVIEKVQRCPGMGAPVFIDINLMSNFLDKQLQPHFAI